MHTKETLHEVEVSGSQRQLFVQEMDVEAYSGIFDRESHPENCYQNPRIETNGTDRPSWYGGLTHTDQAMDLLKKGWAKGANRLGSYSQKVTPPEAKSIRRRPRWGDDGDDLDPDRAMRGQWDTAWRTTGRRSVAGPTVVEVWGSFGGAGAQGAEELFWGGAGSVVLTNILEDAGYRVRLCAVTFAEYGYRQFSLIKVIVKEADESLRIDAVASIMCHAGVFRTLGFKAILRTPWNVGSAYGRSLSIGDGKDILEAAGEMDSNAIVVPYSYSGADEMLANLNRIVGNLQK